MELSQKQDAEAAGADEAFDYRAAPWSWPERGRTPWGALLSRSYHKEVRVEEGLLSWLPGLAGLCPGIKAPWDGCCISMEAATFAGIWSMPRALAQCCLL